jgi:hypothetical protein
LTQSLVERAKGQINLLKDAAATRLRVAELEKELKEVCEVAALEKKKLEDELTEEKRKTKEANAQINSLTIGKVEILCW